MAEDDEISLRVRKKYLLEPEDLDKELRISPKRDEVIESSGLKGIVLLWRAKIRGVT